MRVRAIQKYVPYVGGMGAEKEMDARSARVLILLGKVEEVKKPKPPPKQPRTYKRRDMVAEMFVPEEVADKADVEMLEENPPIIEEGEPAIDEPEAADEDLE